MTYPSTYFRLKLVFLYFLFPLENNIKRRLDRKSKQKDSDITWYENLTVFIILKQLPDAKELLYCFQIHSTFSGTAPIPSQAVIIEDDEERKAMYASQYKSIF